MLGEEVAGCEAGDVGEDPEDLLPAGQVGVFVKDELIELVHSVFEYNAHGWTEGVVIPVVVVADLEPVCSGFRGAHPRESLRISGDFLRNGSRKRRSSKVEVIEFA